MEKHRRLSKYVSLILRHKPELAGILLDEHGWANVEDLVSGISQTGRTITMKMLEEIVETDHKQRYSFNSEKTRIRANQGHSVPVDLELEAQMPPSVLYHGTASVFLEAILEEGLKPMGRLYVHLSKDVETAVKVGGRHGKPVVLKLPARNMYQDGQNFYLSQNGVWLTDIVDKKYIEVLP